MGLYLIILLYFCKSWYLKQKYNGSEVGVEYFGFKIYGFDFLYFIKIFLMIFFLGLVKFFCKSFYVNEKFLNGFFFFLVVDLVELICFELYFVVLFEIRMQWF